MKAFIKAISYALPEKELTNEELVREFPEWSVEKIANKVGINKRFIVEKMRLRRFGSKAAENYLKIILKLKRTLLILCYFALKVLIILPTSACVIQDKLGLSTSCGALDFNLGCSGYVYGLSLAKGLIFGGIANNVLLLTGETYSKFIHPKDKGNRTIFGDAGSATLISKDGFAEIGGFCLGTDGKGAENLMVKSGGIKYRDKLNDLEFDESGNPISSDHLFMNGTEIFNFTIDAVPALVKDTLVKNSLSNEEIDGYVFHQANKFMINFLRKKLKINPDIFHMYMSEVGNTVSNTIPIVLTEKLKENGLKGNILLAGFGVGYSWGGGVLKFD